MLATLKGSKLKKSRVKGTPSVNLMFETQEGKRLYWDGYLTENTKDRTIKTILDMGFNGSDLTELFNPVGYMFLKHDFDLVIETDEQGYERVKWINDPNAKKEYSTEEFVGLDFKGDIIRLRGELGGQTEIPF